ncbi:hypothetical protein D9M72_564860 [compost metagenome]
MRRSTRHWIAGMQSFLWAILSNPAADAGGSVFARRADRCGGAPPECRNGPIAGAIRRRGKPRQHGWHRWLGGRRAVGAQWIYAVDP